MPITVRFIARRRSTPARASSWTGRHSLTGLVVQRDFFAPVLDPGRKKVKLGQLWAYARDDRPHVFASEDVQRGTEHCRAHLAGFSGIPQTDGYAAYKEFVKSRGPSEPAPHCDTSF